MKLRSAFLLIISSAVLLFAQTPEVEITAEPHHYLVLQNPFVRVFKVEVAPHAATLMHHHRHDYVFVTLGASEVENDVQGKPPATLKLKDGDTYFLPGGFAHIAKNLVDQPFRNVTIEFMQDEKARKSPAPKWDEERGMHILEGGTQDILFVKDGVKIDPLLYGGPQEWGRRAGREDVGAATAVAVALSTCGRDRAKRAAVAQRQASALRAILVDLGGTPTGAESRLPNFATCAFADRRGEDLLLALDLAGVSASSGSACASGSLDPSHVLLAMGLSLQQALGSLRLTTGYATTDEEVSRAEAILRSVLARAPARA